MKAKLIILGAGGSAQQVCWLVSRLDTFELIGFYDETAGEEKQYLGYPIKNSLDSLIKREKGPVMLISAVGDISLRRRWHSEFGSSFEFATIIDPSAIIAPNANIGKDVIVHAFSTISTNTEVQDSTYISWNCLIAHDVSIGKFTQISPGTKVTGRCRIGNFCRLGTNSSILPDVMIGDGAIIGAGAVVSRNIPENVMAAGVPAVIKKVIS